VVGLLGQCGFWRDVLANVCGRTGPQEEQEKAAESQLTHEPSQQSGGQKGKKRFLKKIYFVFLLNAHLSYSKCIKSITVLSFLDKSLLQHVLS